MNGYSIFLCHQASCKRTQDRTCDQVEQGIALQNQGKLMFPNFFQYIVCVESIKWFLVSAHVAFAQDIICEESIKCFSISLKPDVNSDVQVQTNAFCWR
jgi:hypothetical protein